MLKKFTALLVALFLTIGIVGCAKKDKVIYTEPAPPKKDIQAKKRPESKTDIVKIGTTDKSITFKLYDDPNLEFTTYIPEDMNAKSKEGDFLSIYSNFNGEENKNAKLYFFSPIKTVKSTVENMKKVAVDNAKEDGFEILDSNGEKLISDSELEFNISKTGSEKSEIVGKISIFNHNERLYYVRIQYPLDYKEEFVPRAKKILENIMFYDEKVEENK